ncbi:hypothetical protein CVT24_002390 [Panaeolus cyanescens]|uniref:Uncharacterized protein n=1 Tax=Panaeolus cyanescens TaxID=181874 RepID=A0A409X4T4_9AGAR|nr:hypothetical protein CVT24_002390 [Panaeolus cyanescens]
MPHLPHLKSKTTKSKKNPRFPPLLDASTEENIDPFASILDSGATHARRDDSDACSIAISFNAQQILDKATDVGLKTRRSCTDAIEIISDVDRDKEDVPAASTIPTAERDALYKLVDEMKASLTKHCVRHTSIADQQNALIGNWSSFVREGGMPPPEVENDCDDTARVVACIQAQVLHKRGNALPIPRLVHALQDMIATSRLSSDCTDIETYFDLVNDSLGGLQEHISSVEWKPMDWRSQLVLITNCLVPYISVVSSSLLKLSFNHDLLLSA